ncbi:hypothetical protein [Pseudomonas sp. CAM1A]|uniref:hypothetical protein n=1 Tax=Pseudomonas sp. CAM1A TaxID=3231717 RepID=UPI0039C63DA9
MPTENRSSNTEMVSVPREAVEQAAELLQEYNKCSIARELRAALAKPAEQHQAEPVAWRGVNELGDIVTEWIDGAPPEAMVDLCGNPASFASLELAYTNADPGEVERLRADLARMQANYADALKASRGLWQDRDRMEKQLAERDALLRDLLNCNTGFKMRQRIEAALSASAEPQVKS